MYIYIYIYNEHASIDLSWNILNAASSNSSYEVPGGHLEKTDQLYNGPMGIISITKCNTDKNET